MKKNENRKLERIRIVTFIILGMVKLNKVLKIWGKKEKDIEIQNHFGSLNEAQLVIRHKQ